MQEIKEVNKSTRIPCSWIGRLNNVKTFISLKLIYTLKQTQTIILLAFL